MALTPLDMTSAAPVLAHDWLGACRRAAAALQEIIAAATARSDRTEETGTRGEGGDRTLVIDQLAEDAVFRELDGLHESGARFTAISEERGTVAFGDPSVLVVIDPIDGSTNAKRGLPHAALSVAVADGPTMADVVFGYVFDLGPGEEWFAVRGGGAFLDGEPVRPQPERRRPDGRLELVAVESARPRYLAQAAEPLEQHVHRVRAIGAIAVSLCQVAATRVDGMATLWKCRAVDAAAGQLIVRESGGLVAFGPLDDPLGAPLDLEPHRPVVAARSQDGLERLSSLPVGED
jgi:myo-inositol-1(or 4)-monophosphatase